MPKFLTKDENGQFTIPCDFDDSKFCTNDNNFEYIKDKKNSVDNFTYAFDLYCSKEFFIPLYSTLFFFGGLIGSILFASIPDKFHVFIKFLASSLVIFVLYPIFAATVGLVKSKITAVDDIENLINGPIEVASFLAVIGSEDT